MIQIVKSKCCMKVFAACTVPDCYKDSEWMKNLRKYAERGDIIEIVENGTYRFERCECKKGGDNDAR